MKSLFYLIMVITLPLIAYFQYQSFRRFHPPADYSWPVSAEVDSNYHDPRVLLDYYERIEELGTYARWAWSDHELDVLNPDRDDPEAKEILRAYEHRKATLRYLEGRLTQSAQLKKQGWTNASIMVLEKEGPIQDMIVKRELARFEVLAQRGDENALVHHAQQLLIKHGYTLKVDGVFDVETEETIKTFQADRALFTSGKLDRQSLALLMDK
ncbi:MAG: peptidoglycan-binding domain-containing protein [Bacteroidota bacterium]